MTPTDAREQPHRVAQQALVATAGLYLGYAALGWVLPDEYRYVALIVAFCFLPGLMLRNDPERQQRYQIETIIPPWSWSATGVALLTIAVIFPVFIVGFWWFYTHACGESPWLVEPLIRLEAQTPAAGQLEHFLGAVCRYHGPSFWPTTIRTPPHWAEYGGLGGPLAVLTEVLVVALPEELFHRGYLMSALEERWPPRRRWLGVPFGVAALLSSVLFAVGHLVGMAQLARLTTFFPALLFAWLWRRTSNLWSPILVHAAANLLMAVLLASTFPR